MNTTTFRFTKNTIFIYFNLDFTCHNFHKFWKKKKSEKINYVKFVQISIKKANTINFTFKIDRA